jgi:hypothetical protein
MRLKPILCLVACTALVLGTPLAALADANYDLIQAAFNGNAARVNQLVGRGANVNARDDYGYTPLMWAAQEGYIQTLEALIKRGADVNARDKAGRTALLIATVKGHQAIVKSLLAHRADPTLKANNGISALEYARLYRMAAIQRMMEAPMQQAAAKPTAKPVAHPTPLPMLPQATPRPAMPQATPKPMAPQATPKPAAATPVPAAVSGSLTLSAPARDSIAKLHGRFMDHLGLRDPEAIVQKGFNQDLEDKLDQVFLALDYGHTSVMAKQKLADARKMVNAAKVIAANPDPQDDKICRQILASVDDLLKSLGF